MRQYSLDYRRVFNAAVRRLDNDLDLTTAPFARLDGAATGSMLNTRLSRCIFMPFGYRSSPRGARRASCPASSPRWVHTACVPAPLGRCYPHTKPAIGMVRQSDEHPMTNSSGMNLDSFGWPAKRASIRDDTSKTRQICAGLGNQGSQLRDEVQRLEYQLDITCVVRCPKIPMMFCADEMPSKVE